MADRVTVTLSSDRFEFSPWGVFGGKSASSGNCQVILPDGTIEQLPSKVTRVLEKGSRLISTTPGGGGWGNPYERSPEKVRQDVIQGLLTRESALKVYGIVIGDDFSLDIEATLQQRRKQS